MQRVARHWTTNLVAGLGILITLLIIPNGRVPTMVTAAQLGVSWGQMVLACVLSVGIMVWQHGAILRPGRRSVLAVLVTTSLCLFLMLWDIGAYSVLISIPETIAPGKTLARVPFGIALISLGIGFWRAQRPEGGWFTKVVWMILGHLGVLYAVGLLGAFHRQGLTSSDPSHSRSSVAPLYC